MRGHSKKNNSEIRNLSKGRTFLFKIIGIVLPFFLLGLMELSLRFFNYGYNFSLFITDPHNKNFLAFNPDASKKYFLNQQIATTGNVEFFKRKKDSNTIRIFVLGESTTIGYPYFHNGSFHRWLLYRLMHTYPNKNFEIINLSLTAVNSYTVLGFAKEVVHYQPDAVLIYVGHNEYYGALGVGSTQRIGGSPFLVNLTLDLRELRLTQLLSNWYSNLKHWLHINPIERGGTRMELMVANRQIPYDSELFYRGINQYRSNMNKILRLFSRYHIPVFVSTLVSNERSMKPFVSAPVDSAQYPDFSRDINRGTQAMTDSNWNEARIYLHKAYHIFPGHALCNYYLGRLACLRGNSIQAKWYFSRAKDFDELRFRAPDQFNKIIIGLCHEYKDAHLVDTRREFEAYSKYHIIGDELILDHVHPNLTGYALMSDAFYKAMKRSGLFGSDTANQMSLQQLLQQMPITEVDSLTGIYRIDHLKEYWPFNDVKINDSLLTRSEQGKLAFAVAFLHMPWEDAMSDLYNYYMSRSELSKAKIVMGTLVLEHPAEEPYYEKMANLCGKLNDSKEAIFYFKKAFNLSPSFDKARDVFVIELKLDQPANALPYIEYAISNNTSGISLLPVEKLTAEIIQLEKIIKTDSTNFQILNQIATAYIEMGNKEGANKYLSKVLKMDPDNQIALTLTKQLE
ncbi:MAG: hypothetical protein EPN39_00660 [Chitinophagaceae bacterium]|nr:MAG: hypothetical protein EPN39_00660 [Chitinophagaceae bacterium]